MTLSIPSSIFQPSLKMPKISARPLNFHWGEHPMVSARCPAYCHRVKHKKINPKPAMTPLLAADLRENETAGKAYFSHVNQNSSQGHEVRHWLEAEAQLLAERKFPAHKAGHKTNFK
jgi:Protein of unknown function (DUF2934)